MCSPTETTVGERVVDRYQLTDQTNMNLFIRRAYLTLILTIASIFSLKADHITGGEFTVEHLEGNTFLGVLSLYRDCNGMGANFDPDADITVFDAVTHENLMELSFTFVGFDVTTPELGNSCFVPDVCLEIGVYTQEFTLPDNPNGYYLSKERCCRNDLSVNLSGVDLGFVFTVDVPDPALENSTPVFNPYPNEAYLCINGANTIDFGATDADGDSLVYSFTQPLNGSSTAFAPNPAVASSKPYAEVTWAGGYSTDNQVGGANPMTIDPETGIIVAQPDQVGIFTIAVKVEEYRNGVKIGQIRRELQLSSTACTYDEPSIISTATGDTIFDVLANTTFCIPIDVTDPNSGDTLFVQAEGELIDGAVMPMAVYPDANGFSTIVQDLCWAPKCHNVREEPYTITITAFSRGCAPETLISEQTLYFNVILEVDEPTDLAGPPSGEAIIDLYDPSTHCFEFEFFDPNAADSLMVIPDSELFDMEAVTALEVTFDQGSATLPFCWEVTCDDVRDEPYYVDFLVVTTNCEVQDTTVFSVPITVMVPDDEPSEFFQPAETITWQFYDTDTFCAPIVFADANYFDTLEVSAESEIFGLGAHATTDTMTNNSVVEGHLCWSPACTDVREEPYVVTLTGTANSCKTDKTVEMTIEIFLTLPPENPVVIEYPSSDSILHFIGGDPIDIDILATDIDPYDTLTLHATSSAFTAVGHPAEFERIPDFGIPEAVQGRFTWSPTCADVDEEPYLLTVEARSESCQKQVSRFVEIPILVTTPTRGDIEPIPNIITPNGDGKNEVWTIENKNDPCLLEFRSRVFDRWGRQVYETDNPGFEWDGENEGTEVTTGEYYHTIEYFYKNAVIHYSGNITVVR